MKVSEKSLELNIGAELLWLMRNQWGMPKAYLRGLTQAEERKEGVDFFAELTPASRIFAFQFKAPHGKKESSPYKFTLVKYQHEPLFDLSTASPYGVFYVLPFYVTFKKLQQRVPTLITDTWLINVREMDPSPLFGNFKTRTIRCANGKGVVNPEYDLTIARALQLNREYALPAPKFAGWYREFHRRRPSETRHGNPWLARGLRVAIVEPE